MSDRTLTFASRLRWVAGGMLVACGLTVTACGSTSAARTSRPTMAPTPTINSPSQTVNSKINSPKQAAPILNVTPAKSNGPTNGSSGTPTASSGPSFAKITGWYTGGTADAGWLYIRSDGASRFRAPDNAACPVCTTASAPIGSLDFSLSALSATGPGAYTASGTVTATSDPAWAVEHFSPEATVGSPISVTIAPGGQLTLSVLPSFDVLTGPTAALTTTMPLPVLNIPPSPAFAGPMGRYPTMIIFSGDSGNVVARISWTSWGPQEAVGHGTWTYQNCVPSCASGSNTPYPATLTLSNPAAGMYTTITEVRTGPHRGSPVVVNDGSRGWSDPALAAQ